MSFNISAILHVVLAVDVSADLSKHANWVKIQLHASYFGERICIGRIKEQVNCGVYKCGFALQCLMSCFTYLDLVFLSDAFMSPFLALLSL